MLSHPIFMAMMSGRRTASPLSGAAAALLYDSSGLAVDFSDQSVVIKDTGTPANEYLSAGILDSGTLIGPQGKLSYASPSPKVVRQTDGTYLFAPHNLLLQSDNFGSASWTKGTATGSGTTLTANAGTGVFPQAYQTVAVVAGLRFVHVFEAAPGTNNFLQVYYTNAFGSTHQNFRLTDGVAGTGSLPAAYTVTSAILSGGWYRYTITGPAQTSSLTVFYIIQPTNSAARAAGSSPAGTESVQIRKSQVRYAAAQTDYVQSGSAQGIALPYECYAGSSITGTRPESARTELTLQNTDLRVTHHLTVTGGAGTFADGETVTATGGGTGVYLLNNSSTTVFALRSGSGTFTGTLTGGTSGATKTISSAATVWTLSSVTAAQTAMGPDGIANSATTLTATGANGTVLQAITSGSATRATGCWIKRRTGSGNIDLTQDNGSTWVTVAVTSSWAFYPIAGVTSTNPTVGIRLVSSGDAVDVAWFSHSVTGNGSLVEQSPIPCATTSVAHAADSISLATSLFPSMASGGSVVVSGYIRPDVDNPWGNYYYSLSTASIADTAHIAEINGTRAQVITASATQFDSTVGVEPAAGELVTAILVYQTNSAQLFKAGTPGTLDTSVTMPTAPTILYIGARGDLGAGRTDGIIKNITVVPRIMNTWEAQARSGPTTVKVVCDGNSMSVSSTYIAGLQTLLGSPSYSVGTVAVSGQTTAQMISDAASEVDPYITNSTGSFNGRAALFAWEGTNDIGIDGADLTTLQSRWNTYFSARAAAGWASGGNKLIAATIIACGTFTAPQESVRVAFNSWLRTNYSTYATHLVDLANDARFQNPADTTYYNVDTIHPNAGGNAVIAQIIKDTVWP